MSTLRHQQDVQWVLPNATVTASTCHLNITCNHLDSTALVVVGSESGKAGDSDDSDITSPSRQAWAGVWTQSEPDNLFRLAPEVGTSGKTLGMRRRPQPPVVLADSR